MLSCQRWILDSLWPARLVMAGSTRIHPTYAVINPGLFNLKVFKLYCDSKCVSKERVCVKSVLWNSNLNLLRHLYPKGKKI